jgi:hypothetical protein
MITTPLSRPHDKRLASTIRRKRPANTNFRIERLNQRTGQWEEIYRRSRNQLQIISYASPELAEVDYPVTPVQRIVRITSGIRTVEKEIKPGKIVSA